MPDPITGATMLRCLTAIQESVDYAGKGRAAAQRFLESMAAQGFDVALIAVTPRPLPLVQGDLAIDTPSSSDIGHG